MDNAKYLRLLDEFSGLIEQPDNQIYRRNDRQLDYVGLMLHCVLNVDGKEIPKGEPLRITYVHNELSVMLENAKYADLLALKDLLNESGYSVKIDSHSGEINFTIEAYNFDLTIIID